MRPFGFALAFVIAVSSLVDAQTELQQSPPPQTARQALIEMLFGQAPGHLEKHLPEATRQAAEKLGGTNGQDVLRILAALSEQSRAEKGSLETFDTGPTLVTMKGPATENFEKLDIAVERDDLLGDEDQIELVPHVFNNGKEEALVPMILRFTFTMKMEAEVWRLNELSAAARFPLADPAFLKELTERQLRQNEQMSMWSVRMLVSAEKSYQASQGGYACTLSALGGAEKSAGAAKHVYLYDPQLARGKKNGYRYTIAECDATHYRFMAEPEAQDSGQRAYCADESGTVRTSSDGKGATCLANGEVVEEKAASAVGIGVVLPNSSASASVPSPQRVRVSQGIAQALLAKKVAPAYPAEARQAKIQGAVVLQVLISKTGDVANVELVSGHPMLAPAAMEAVRKWKYKPYPLNGNAVNVETQVTVNFALSQP